MSTPTPPPASPTLSDILTALSVMNRQTPPVPAAPLEERGLAKHASTIIVAIILALCLWVGASVTTLSTTVTRMSANVDAVQKSITDLQASQGSAAQQLSAAQATNAKQDARADAVDADLTRVRERMRILEGQKPLTGDREPAHY